MPQGTPLGELKLVETFFYYDGPRIFSCVSLTDQLYLAFWVEEGDSRDTWLYIPVSQARLGMVRSGGISLRACIESPEGFAYVVTMPYSDEEREEVNPVRPSSIPDEWLPEPTSFLDLDTHTLPIAEPDSVIEFKARQESRTRLRLRVKIPELARSEAPVRAVGALLTRAQSLYDNFGYSIQEENPSDRGPIPADITAKTGISLVGAAASSFMLELASAELDDLFGNSLFSEVTQKLLTLLDLELEYSELAHKLAEVKPRAAKSFRSLVEKMAETGGDVTVAAAGVGIGYSKRELSAERLQDFLRVLNRLTPEEEVVVIRGRMRLYKVDTKHHTFGLRDESLDPHVEYEGAIDDAAWQQASHATVEENYDVLVTGTTVIDETVGDKRTTYRLAQISHTSGEVQ
jgi:hypothetical protein